MPISPTLALAQQLIRCPSVTPEDGGCQTLIRARLGALGFHCETMNYHAVTNLWATHAAPSAAAPLFVFAGHTDVVPPGPLTQWTHPPYAGELCEGRLYGRGAADMKGSIASFVVACERFIARHPQHRGRLGLLITSDEEGPARWGTRAVMDELAARGEVIDFCLVGEPSSTHHCGDTVKIGRRGSLGGRLTIYGKQGHIAYPQLADNPLHRALAPLQQLLAHDWEPIATAASPFPPTSLQFSNMQGGSGATNVIPGQFTIDFNFRYSPRTTAAALRPQCEAILTAHGIRYEIEWNEPGLPFITAEGELLTAVTAAIWQVTGLDTECSTAGGTSDGRFIAPTGAQVVELGPVNATIHQIDEQVAVADLEVLTDCYEHIINRLLAPA